MPRWTIALKFCRCPDELCIGIIKIIGIIGNGWASDRFLKFCPCQMRVRPKKPSKGVCGESVEKCPVSSVSPVKHYSELISALPMIESSSGSSGMDEPAPKSPQSSIKPFYSHPNASSRPNTSDRPHNLLKGQTAPNVKQGISQPILRAVFLRFVVFNRID